jgi:hypothetical protein
MHATLMYVVDTSIVIDYYKLDLGKFWVRGSPFIWIDHSFFASLHLVPWHNYSKIIHLGRNNVFNMVKQCSQFLEKQAIIFKNVGNLNASNVCLGFRFMHQLCACDMVFFQICDEAKLVIIH